MARHRISIPSLVLGAALALAAAGPATAQTADSPDDDAPPPSPAGDGCAGVIARWQDFSGRESRGGHMDQSVYDQIQAEIDRASRLCGAGQDAQARRAVADSRRRHGY